MNDKATFKESFPIIEKNLSILYAMSPSDNVATRIYKLRKIHDLSFKEFGKRVGVGVSTAHKWENDVRDPSEESLDKIIKAFDLNKDYFDMKKD